MATARVRSRWGNALRTLRGDISAAIACASVAVLTCAAVAGADGEHRLIDAVRDPEPAAANAHETSRVQTALMWAIAEGHPDLARVLVEGGADVHARSGTYRQRVSFGPERATGDPRAFGWITKGGSTPLLFAARAGDVE